MLTTKTLFCCMLLSANLLLAGATWAAPEDAHASSAAKTKPDPQEAGGRTRRPPDSIKVRIIGTLRTGIAAIGGETTGTTITAKGITWELDFGTNTKFREIAEKFDGKRVMVRGRLERRPGVEIKERWIITVTELRPAEALNRKSIRAKQPLEQ